MVGVIRHVIGFDGLLMSDDIGMQALSGDMAERAGASIAAGCDLVLACNLTRAELAEVAAASGRLTPASAIRADAALARRTAPDAADPAALRAELAALTDLRSENILG